MVTKLKQRNEDASNKEIEDCLKYVALESKLSF